MNKSWLPGRMLAGLAISFALVALAAVARIWPLQSLGSTLVWLTFYPAVIVAAASGRPLVGLIATGLSCLTALYLWPFLVAQPFITKPADWWGMAIFIVNCSMICGIGEALRRGRARVAIYCTLFESMDEGFCEIEMIYDADGKPVDYRFVEINPAFEKQTGLFQAQGKTIRQMVPEHDEHWFEIYGNVARTGEAIRFENEATAMHRHFDVYAYRIGDSRRIGILFKDITANKELQNTLTQYATTDALTGCNNRRHFMEIAEQEFIRARRYDSGISVLMLDLDHFKTINDTYGHHAGDKVLKECVNVCSRLLREVDVMGRLGGEEFAILLPETGIERASEIADRLYKAVAAMEIPIADDCCLRITTSIGIACLVAEDLDFEALLNRADTALYKAKRTGRNRALT